MRRGRNALFTALGAVLTVAALAVPAYAYVHFSAPDTVLDRHGAPEPSRSDDELADLVAAAAGPGDPAASGDAGDAAGAAQPPLILSYHDVQPDPGPEERYTVSPQQLADHLAMLRVAGYQSITSAELVAWLDGTGTLPPKPVMLTFDDGATGVWSHADAILEDQGFTGVVFIVTSRVGTSRPYYLSADELDRLVESGRWEVQSHTRDGHDRIPVDADEDGDRLPFLITRTWLADEQRLETRAEFESRIRADLAGSDTDLDRWAVDGTRLFSYPFSAATELVADPAATVTASDVVAEVFDASMTNVLPDRLVTERDRAERLLPRVEVFQATSTEDLLTRITQAVPVAPSDSAPLAEPSTWTDTSGEPFAGATTGDVDQGSESADAAVFDERASALTLHAEPGGYLAAHHLPGRSADWAGYRIRTLVGGLGDRAGGPTGSLFALLGSDEQVQVSTSASFVRVVLGAGPAQRTVFEQAVPVADLRMLSIEVAAGELVVHADGVELLRRDLETSPSGGIGVAATNGPVRFSAMRLQAGESAPSAPNPTSGFEVTSGEWVGRPDGTAATGSPVFRARSQSTHGDVQVTLRFRIEEYSSTSEDHEWDGVHLGVRYASPNDLYYVSVARRDGTIAIKRKSAGVYETLAVGDLPLGVGEWHEASVTVTGGPSGVTIALTVDGQPALSTIDTAAPLGAPGRVSVRSDNVRVEFGELTIRDL